MVFRVSGFRVICCLFFCGWFAWLVCVASADQRLSRIRSVALGLDFVYRNFFRFSGHTVLRRRKSVPKRTHRSSLSELEHRPPPGVWWASVIWFSACVWLWLGDRHVPQFSCLIACIRMLRLIDISFIGNSHSLLEIDYAGPWTCPCRAS